MANVAVFSPESAARIGRAVRVVESRGQDLRWRGDRSVAQGMPIFLMKLGVSYAIGGEVNQEEYEWVEVRVNSSTKKLEANPKGLSSKNAAGEEVAAKRTRNIFSQNNAESRTNHGQDITDDETAEYEHLPTGGGDIGQAANEYVLGFVVLDENGAPHYRHMALNPIGVECVSEEE